MIRLWRGGGLAERSALVYMIVVFGGLLLAGCAGSVSGLTLDRVALEDVRQAKIMAEHTHDALSLQCWTYLEAKVSTLAEVREGPQGKVVGVLSTYQAARNIRRVVTSIELTEQFKVECGPMLYDSARVITRLGGKVLLPF